LTGIRVLDMTRLLPGPLAGQHLAHLGAEVIKVEDRQMGDYGRQLGALGDSTSHFFMALNRSKAFIQVDLKDPADYQAFVGLVKTSDVVIEGFRPGVMERLKLGFTTLQKINPALVLCSITGYGQDGPLALAAGHDINYLSYTGVLLQNATREGKTAMAGLQIADLLGGTQAAVIGVLAALVDARSSGRGRHVDISMTDVVFAHNIMATAHVNESGDAALPGSQLLTGGEPCYNIYSCADQRLLAVGALEAKFWQAFCQGLGKQHLASKHWESGQVPGGPEARAVIEEVAAALATRDQADWLAIFEPLDCCVTPILSAKEALAHPLFKARKMVETVKGPLGASQMPAFPIRFVGEDQAPSNPAKARGADQEIVDKFRE
jgi:crotonobetainyl-CoA:carnitine CoA-transferase CaiB-like acyl-CoA transferase